jgi:hypothetical protein
MKARRLLQRALELLKRDVGRIALAFVFALFLFEVLDKQVQADDSLTVPIVYVDEAGLGQVPENPEDASVLLVAERGGAGKPLVVADSPRPIVATLQLHASKDALERVKSRRHRFVWRLGKEGPLTPVAEDFEGVEALTEELGPGARVELAPRMRFNVEAEESLSLVLADSDLEFVGSPAAGFDRSARTVAFHPAEIQLVGPRSVIVEAQRRRAELFEKIDLDGRSASIAQPLRMSSTWRDRLRLLDTKGAPLATVGVSADFARRMVALTGADGRFELAVQVIQNDDRLQKLGEGRSSRDGWRLELTKAVNGPLRIPLQILVPDTQVSGVAIDRAKIDLAKASVELEVRAHEATVERTTLPVYIVRFKDFPEGLDVVFAEGQSNVQVEVSWKKPEPGAHGAEDKSGKKTGDGG